MPTIIDSLIVELGLDGAGMEAGRRQVEDAFKKVGDGANRAGKDVDKTAKNAEVFLNKLRNNILALYAAFTTGRGIKEFVADITASDAALGRLAASMDMSAKTLASWRAAGSLVGASAQDIDGSFQALQSDFQNFGLTGQSTIVPWFRRLGVAVSDVNGRIRPLNDVLLDLADRVHGMDKAQAVAILSHMGLTPGAIQLILQGRDAILKMQAATKELSDAQAKDTAAAAERQAAWAKLLGHWEAVGITILTKLTPALDMLAGALDAIGKWFDEHPTIAGAAFIALSVAVGALTVALGALAISGAFAAIAAGFGLITTALAWVSGAVAIIGVIGAISFAVYELFENLDLVRKAWNWIMPAWLQIGGKDKSADKPGANSAPGSPNKASAGVPLGGSNPINLKSLGGSSEQQQQDIADLQKMGWSREQAIGIVANLQAESAGNTSAVGDNGKAYGLAQWHADRQRAFAAWAGHDIRSSTRAEQLAFVNFELRQGSERATGDKLAGAKDHAAAAQIIAQYYERPADTAGAVAQRVKYADDIAKAHSATTAALAKAFTTAPAPGVISGAQGVAQAGNVANDNSASNVTTSETKIGQVVINGVDTNNGKTVADAFKDTFRRDQFVAQANSGPA